jgi:hypothetical protein
MTPEEDFLAHYGVKGMHWGQRKRPEGVSRGTNRLAKKDAKEFARAKMFYGDGAGTRRKLVKAKVESHSKANPNYKKAFDQHLQDQDLGKHAEKATGERKRKDAGTRAKQRVGYVARRLTGEMGTQAAFVAAGAAGYSYLNSPKGRAMKKSVMSTVNNAKAKHGKKSAEAILKNLEEFMRKQG